MSRKSLKFLFILRESDFENSIKAVEELFIAAKKLIHILNKLKHLVDNKISIFINYHFIFLCKLLFRFQSVFPIDSLILTWL